MRLAAVGFTLALLLPACGATAAPLPVRSICALSDHSLAGEVERSERIVRAVALDAHVEGYDEVYGLFVGVSYRVRVLETFAGAPVREITVFSENTTGRFPLDIGVPYVLFLQRDDLVLESGEAGWIADSCGNSAIAHDDSPLLAALRKLPKSRP